METALKERLWDYIIIHNPELMYHLQEQYLVGSYLQRKVNEVLPQAQEMRANGVDVCTILEACIEELTQELKPSKFQFVRRVIQEEFPAEYQLLSSTYMLDYEVLNIVDASWDIFQQFGPYCERENSKIQRYAVMHQISTHLCKAH